MRLPDRRRRPPPGQHAAAGIGAACRALYAAIGECCRAPRFGEGDPAAPAAADLILEGQAHVLELLPPAAADPAADGGDRDEGPLDFLDTGFAACSTPEPLFDVRLSRACDGAEVARFRWSSSVARESIAVGVDEPRRLPRLARCLFCALTRFAVSMAL